MRKYILLFCAVFMAMASQCTRKNGASDPEERRRSTPEERLEAQRDFLELERESIEAYIKDRNLKMNRSGTGLYYQAKLDSSQTRTANTGDIVEFNYEISLLNGRPLYSSRESGSRNLMIDKQDAEIGVHELLKLMSVGEKALFILPSHLAFGVAGDQVEVPPKTPLAYEVEILKIDKSNK